MPRETLRISGNEYLYFSYYDAATRKKKRIYCGPKSDSRAQKKAAELEKRRQRMQLEKNAASKRFSLSADLVADVEAQGCDSQECKEIMQCLIDAYPDLEWITSDYTSLLGWLNESDETFRDRFGRTLEKLKENVKRISDAKSDLRYLLDHAYSGWESRIRYRSLEGGDPDAPEWDPAAKHRSHDQNQNPRQTILEILEGLVDASEHAQKRLETAIRLSEASKLEPLSKALTFFRTPETLESSRKSFLLAVKFARNKVADDSKDGRKNGYRQSYIP